MKLKHVNDIDPQSSFFSYTPSLASKQLPFYLEGCGHFIAHQDYYTERENLNSFLLFYTLSGRGYLKYRNIESCLGANQAAVIYCCEYQLYRTASQEPWVFKWIHFNGQSAKHYFDLINENTINVISLENSSEFERTIDIIAGLASYTDMINDIKISNYLTTIMSKLMIDRYTSQNNQKFYQHQSDINKVVQYIRNNYHQNLSMDDLTGIVHLSKYHFLRLFKCYTGTTPYEYLTQYRVNQSKALLKTTSMTVSEVAYKVGFNDANNFIRAFKKLVGTTPLKYKRYWIS